MPRQSIQRSVLVSPARTPKRKVGGTPRKTPGIKMSSPHSTASKFKSPSSSYMPPPSHISVLVSKAKRPPKGPETVYHWISYTIKNDPIKTGAPDSHHHIFSKTASGSIRTTFKDGSVARNVFEKMFKRKGMLDKRVYDLTDLVAVYNPETKTVTAFRGMKRYDDNLEKNKLYTGVKAMAIARVASVQKFYDMKWERSHGRVSIV